MKRDPVVLAKLRSMGVGTRGIVWRIGQSLTWAALLRGRAADVAGSNEWHAKAKLLGEALGAEPPPLPLPLDDSIKGSAAALGYVLRTVPTAMADAIEPYGDDHLGLFECALKLGLIDFLGIGKGEMLESIATAVRSAGLRGKLPESFQQLVGQIVAAVGTDRGPELILEAYQTVSRLLGEESASKPGDPAEPTAAGASPPVAPAVVSRSAAPDPAQRRLQIYLLAAILAMAVSLHPHPEDVEKARSRLRAARELAATLGVTIAELPALAGERGEDWRRCLDFLEKEVGGQLAAAIGDRFGPAQGALFAAMAQLTLFAQRYQASDAAASFERLGVLLEELSRSELPAELWGSLLAIEVAMPDNPQFDEWYVELRKTIRKHLEDAVE